MKLFPTSRLRQSRRTGVLQKHSAGVFRRVRKSKPRGRGKHWLNKPDVVKRGKREICNLSKLGGQYEYYLRIWLMWVRQDGLCCNCREPLRMREATFEHENGRGAAKHDDRIAIEGKNGRFKPINGASHLICNSQRGSRRTALHHGTNVAEELDSFEEEEGAA